MDDLRKDFEEAFEEVEKELSEEIEEALEEEETEEAEETEEVEEEEDDDDSEEEEDTTEEASETEEVSDTPAPNGKAPASWSAKARESWSKVPSDAQAQIEKREREITLALENTKDARNFAKRLNDTLQPYQQGLMAAGYQDPLQAVNTFLATEATLRGGTAQDKAYTIANLIKGYGVDIGTLDNLLAGDAPVPQENNQLEQMLNQRLAPVEQLLQQQQQMQQQQYYNEQNTANQQIETFKQSHEFLDDVRQDMANLMDAAAARGESMDLEKAYNIACQINPDISNVLSQRAKEQQMMGTRQQVKKKKAAAVSVTGKPAGEPSKNQNLSLRDEIAAAWNEQVG